MSFYFIRRIHSSILKTSDKCVIHNYLLESVTCCNFFFVCQWCFLTSGLNQIENLSQLVHIFQRHRYSLKYIYFLVCLHIAGALLFEIWVFVLWLYIFNVSATSVPYASIASTVLHSVPKVRSPSMINFVSLP